MGDVFMKHAVIGLFLVLSGATSSMAADMLAPVKTIMGIAEGRWLAENPRDDRFYFDDDVFPVLYSKDFAAHYLEAANHPALDDGTNNPFDYDVVTGGQDGCPLDDIQYKENPAEFGKTRINVTYKWKKCDGFEDAADTEHKVDFIVVVEDGKPVIDDILSFNQEYQVVFDSLKGQMIELSY